MTKPLLLLLHEIIESNKDHPPPRIYRCKTNTIPLDIREPSLLHTKRTDVTPIPNPNMVEENTNLITY